MSEGNPIQTSVVPPCEPAAESSSFIRRWGGLIASLPVVVVIIGCLLFRQNSPPPGREVQYWLLRLQSPRGELARQELLSMGAAALPELSRQSALGQGNAGSKSVYTKMWLATPRWATRLLPYPKKLRTGKFMSKAGELVAAEILHNLEANGPKASSALPVLDQLARDTNSPYQLRAASIAWRISGQSARLTPTLQTKLDTGSSKEQAEAARLAGLLGAEAAPLISRLARLLTSADIEVAQSSAMSLGEIGPEARTATPALIVAANSANRALSGSARSALKSVNPFAHENLQTTPVPPD